MSEAPPEPRLSRLDRLLPLWIACAMGAGLALGRLAPGIGDTLDTVRVDTVSLPIALGLFAMMFPVLAKVRFTHRDSMVVDRRTLGLSLLLNWIVGPLVMFTLAWLLLPGQPALRTGVIVVGLARCIAMVLIWSDLAHGNRELTALLVAVNSVFQIAAYAILGWFYLAVLPGWLGLDTTRLDVGIWVIARSVLIFLGVPLLAAIATRSLLERRRGVEWYEQRFIPRVAPIALYGLLFTIVVLFALQGRQITSDPVAVLGVAAPFVAYFALMWVGSFALGYRMRLGYAENTSLAFTATGNNFELAIAVAIAVFGAHSPQALAGTIGPLVEVPALIGLVYVARWAKHRFYPPMTKPQASVPVAARSPPTNPTR